MFGRPIVTVLAGVALMTVPLCWALLQPGVYVGNGTDLFSYQLPMREAARVAWADGALLAWNPYMLGGVETHAGMQLGLLYPPNVIASLLFGVQASSMLFLLHLLVGGAGAAYLARVWLGDRWTGTAWAPLASAAVWLGSGATWGHLWAGHVAIVETWALWPWVWAAALVAIRRRSVALSALAAAALALQILAGYPQITFLCGMGLVPVLLCEVVAAPAASRATTAAGVVGLGTVIAVTGCVLAAAQLLPTAAFAPTMNRSLATPLEIATMFSAPAHSLYSVFAPHVWGGPGPRLAGVVWHETAAWFGAACLSLVVPGLLRVGARALVFVPFMALFVFLSVGEHSPVLPTLVELVPQLGSFRVPGRWLLPVTALAALLVAEAADAAGATDGRRTPRWQALLVIAPALVALWLAWSLDPGGGWWGARVQAALHDAVPLVGTIRAELVLVGVAGLVAAASVASGSPWSTRALVVMACLEALAFGGRHVGDQFQLPPNAIPWSPGDTTAIRDAVDDEHRLVTAALLRQTNWGARIGVRGAGAYEPAVTREANWYGNRLAGRPVDGYAVNFQVRGPSPWLDRMAVSHALVDPVSAPAWQAWPRQATLGSGLLLHRNPAPLSRVAWADEVRVDAGVKSAIERLPSLTRSQTILSEPLPHTPGAGTRVTIARDAPDALELTAEARAPCVLVVRDAWAPGWSARIDGGPTTMVRADGLFRAVSVPSGTHRVELRFEAPGLRAGGWISAIAWTLLLAFLAGRRRDFGVGRSLEREHAL